MPSTRNFSPQLDILVFRQKILGEIAIIFPDEVSVKGIGCEHFYQKMLATKLF